MINNIIVKYTKDSTSRFVHSLFLQIPFIWKQSWTVVEFKAKWSLVTIYPCLYKRDASLALRSSHENPEIKQLYQDFYGKPLSDLAEKMLHTIYTDRSDDLRRGETKIEKFKCKVCGYIHEGELTSDFVCPICKQPASAFEKI